jgi:Fe(3+) dicitrate transport protein
MRLIRNSAAADGLPREGVRVSFNATESHQGCRWIAVALLGACFLASSPLALTPAMAAAADEAEAEADANGQPADSGARGGESSSGATPTEPFERVKVVGSSDRAKQQPGSVDILDKQVLARQSYADVHRTLSLIPGVTVQGEDGWGLRPNIGMRGSGVERSQKITTMEDGVLVAPAPYSAPSAYYFPTIARMEGIEVRKGSSSIRQGPYTTGGSLNMLSTSIPSAGFAGTVDLAAGQHDVLRGLGRIGGSSERFGWLVESFQMGADGFKRLDGGGSTGFDLQDYMVKLRVNSPNTASMFQALELKLGKTKQLGDETYLGLTDADFASDPYRRYAGSQLDYIDSEHEQIQLRYFVKPSATVDLTTTVYRNDFFRNWHKLDRVLEQGVVGGGASYIGISDVLEQPEVHADELAVLRADLTETSAPDSLAIRNNRRDYFSQGIHTALGLRPGGNGGMHDVEVGLRYHQDQEDRFQDEEFYAMQGDGRMLLTSTGAPGSQSNRVASADVWSLYVQDTITTGRWVVTPGARFESIDYERRDFGKSDPDRTGSDLSLRNNEVDEVIPGVGALYNLNQASNVFASVHKGFAPPGPSAAQQAQPEESINYELGYRRFGDRFGGQFVAFYNDYSNLLGADTLSSGGTGEGDMYNGGESRVYGLEVGVQYDFGDRLGAAWSFPVELAYTYTHGEFLGTFDSEYDPWGSVQSGDQLPYLPEHQASLQVGLRRSRWSVFTNLIYVGEMRTAAGQGPIPVNESTDAHLVVDMTGSYQIQKQLRAYVQVRNLNDEVYIVARRPAGLRPGIGRTWLVGMAFDF